MKGSVKKLLQKNPNKAAEKTTTCKHCGQQIISGAKFCMHCGEQVPEKSCPAHCPGCGAQLPENARFCMKCGLKIDMTDQAAPVTRQQSVHAAPTIKKEKKGGKKGSTILCLVILALLAVKILLPGLKDLGISSPAGLISVIIGEPGVNYNTLSARDISMEVPQGVILERANEEGDGNIIATGNGIYINMMNWNSFAFAGIEALAQEWFDREEQEGTNPVLIRSGAGANTPYVGVYSTTSTHEHITLYCNSQKETWSITISLYPAQTEGVSWETMADSIRFH